MRPAVTLAAPSRSARGLEQIVFFHDPFQNIRGFLRSSANRQPCQFGARGFGLPWTLRRLGFSEPKSVSARRG